MLTEEERAERMAFLTRRQLGIGGSDMPQILGVSNWGDALSVYHSKTRPILPEDIEGDSIHQMRGNTFEPLALDHYKRKTGRRCARRSGASHHPNYPNVVVSIDFDIFADESRDPSMRGTGVGETKSPVSSVYRRVYEEGLRK